MSAKFSKNGNYILAGGAGKNEMRVFDYSTASKICTFSGLEKPVNTIETS